METADNAVLEAVEDFIIAPEVVEKAVERAVRTIAGEGRGERLEQLRREIAAKEQELSRLIDALASGGESGAITAAIRSRESQLAALRSQLAALQSTAIDFDRGKLKRELQTRLRDWKTVLRGTPEAGQRALRALIEDRLTFTPVDDDEGRYYAFSGVGTITPLLSGLVQNGASPPPFHGERTFAVCGDTLGNAA